MVIGVGATLIGLAIETGLGHQELGAVFAVFYFLGCVAAVLAVRRTGIFTAVIQPPLLLFVVVPLAYYLFHNSAFGGLKDVLITCGYPLIERFPLMFFTSAAVLLIGLVRWYRATSAPSHQASDDAGDRPGGRRSPRGGAVRTQRPGLVAALSTKLASAFAGNGSVDEEAGARPARPRHVVDRPGGSRPRRAGDRAAERTRTRSARPRPPTEEFDWFADSPPRPRRQYDRPSDRPAGPRREDEWVDPRDSEPRRRPREPRRTPPPSRREPPPGYRDSSPSRGSSRREPLETYEYGRGYQSQPQYESPYEPRRRPGTGAGSDHHPVSRVRYRDSGPSAGPPAADADGPPRSRPRR